MLPSWLPSLKADTTPYLKCAGADPDTKDDVPRRGDNGPTRSALFANPTARHHADPQRRHWPISCSTASAMSSHVRTRSSNRCEVLIGRSLAACVHPQAAWVSTVRSFRLLLLAGYFTAGYITVLAALTLVK